MGKSYGRLLHWAVPGLEWKGRGGEGDTSGRGRGGHGYSIAKTIFRIIERIPVHSICERLGASLSGRCKYSNCGDPTTPSCRNSLDIATNYQCTAKVLARGVHVWICLILVLKCSLMSKKLQARRGGGTTDPGSAQFREGTRFACCDKMTFHEEGSEVREDRKGPRRCQKGNH